MKKKTFGKIFTLIILILIVLFMNKILNIESFGADEEKVILEGSLDKYINYNLQDQEKGTLVQYTVKAGIEYGDNYIPVKNSELTVNLNQIDGKFPYDVKIITKSTKVTNGKTNDMENNYNYDSNTGTLKINVSNENENSEPINTTRINQEDRDEYIVIAYYDTYTQEVVERNISYDLSYKAVLFTDDNKEITNQGRLENTVTENISDLTSINTSTDEIYNGYMKSNLTNGTSYDTQYKETQEIMISKSDVQQKIIVTEDNEFLNTSDIQYKSTKVFKEDVINLLGENGKIEIFDGDNNVITTIDSNTEFDENGEFVITYPENTNKITIKTSNIENVGILHIENQKAIKADISNLEDGDIKTKVEVKGINEEKVVKENVVEDTQEDVQSNVENTVNTNNVVDTNESAENVETVEEIIEKEVYKVEKENIIEVKNAETKVEMNLDNTQWTNRKQNEVTFDIILNSTSIRDNLFKSPTLKIELPSQVEKVILGNTSIVYANGLTLDNVYTEADENGRISIIADLGGKQSQYNENDLGLMTDIKISATVILKKDIESTQDKVNLVYTNDYNNKEQGNIEKEISIENYEEVQNEQNSSNILENGNDLISTITEAAEKNVQESVREASAEEIEGLKVEIQPVRGDTALKDGDTVYEGEYIKYNVKITNTLDKDIEDIRVVGTIPEGTKYGELDSNFSFPDDYRYQYNFNEALNEKEINIGTLKAGQTIEQSYEIQVKDLLDEEAQKEITTNIKVYIANTESYNYSLNNVIEQAEAKAFLWSKIDGPNDEWLYGVNLDIPEGKQATIKLTLPKIFSITNENVSSGRVYLEAYKTQYSTNIDLREDEETITGASISYNGTEVTITATESGTYKLGLIIGDASIVKEQIKNGELEAKNGEVELKANAVVTIDDKEYKTNENIIPYSTSEVSVTMSSPNEGEEVKYGEEINYNISVTCLGSSMNQGNRNLEGVQVNILDYLPENVNPVSMTYEYFEIEYETVIGDEGEVEVPTGYSEKKVKTEELYSSVADADGNELADVNIIVNIPKGETINITIKTTAEFVLERTEIENSAIVQAPNMDHITENETIDEVDTKISNVIKHIIVPYNVDEPIIPEDPIDPEEPENPTDPEEPENPDNPNNPEDTTYSISGVSWNDINGDGNRQDDESLISGLQVMLVDMADSNNVKTSTTTNNGRYTFSNLEQGNYIVIFRYNTQNYLLTEYKASGVPENSNSDATMQEITLNGDRISVGVTDTISLTQNVNNIDIGLVNRDGYDLKLDKYLTNVSVTTNAGTKYYSYDNTKLGRVEIRAKEINGAEVSVTYKIVVTNEGEAKVKVSEIYDYIPDGLTFSSTGNTNWTADGNTLVNRSLMNQDLNPGESKEIVLTLTKTMNGEDTGTFTNAAEIGSIDTVEGINDADSTPGNRNSSEDDYSEAQLIISISTGLGMYISIGVIVLIIAILTIVAIKLKFNIGKISKLGVSIMLFVLVGMFTCGNAFAVNFHYVSRSQHRFSGGPTGTGYCSNHEWVAAGWHTWIEGDNAYCYHSESAYSNDYNNTNRIDYGATIPTSEGIKLSKRNDQIGVRKIGDNYILGPFQITTNTTGQTITILDKAGSRIDGWGLCDANGNGNNPFGSSGNIDFYISLSSTLYNRGVSYVKLEQTKAKGYSRHWSKTGSRHYTYIGGTCGAVNYYKNHQGVTTSEYVYEEGNDNWNENTSDAVEWVNFNATLDIIKQDADDSDVKLPNVEINVRCDALGYNRNFVTDENGSIHIDNLTPGIYQITENFNANYGYSKVESEQVHIYSGIVREYSLTNEKQTGNLQIVKQDTDSGKFLENVSFKVHDSSGGSFDGYYIIGIDEEGNRINEAKGEVYFSRMIYTDKEEDATTFITDSNGLINIHNIMIGTYTVEEISVGDNYGYDMDDNYISWETDKGSGQGSIATIEVTRQKSYTTVPDSNIIDDDQKVIEDGAYEIQSNVGANKVIEVTNAYPYNGANVALYDMNKSIAQRFYIRYLGEGYYSIISLSANKYVEVAGASTSPGANVQIYQGNNTDAQKWKIEDKGNGNYALVSKCNGLYMDIYGAGTANKTNVQVYTKNDSIAQSFKLNDLTDASGVTESGFSTLTYNNRRKYVRLSGNVWEDIQWDKGKNESMNQLYHDIEDDKKDQLLANITVKLKDRAGNSIPFKDANGNTIQSGEILTDENGHYFMQDVLIDQLENYYIEFSYNGMAYENVDLIDISKPNGTHAIEADYRTEFDENFARITYQGNSSSGNVDSSYSGQSNNSDNEKVNDILYDQAKYESNINYEGNYLFGYYKSTEAEYNDIYTTKEEYETYYPVNGVAQKYIISATTRNAYASVGGTGYITDIMTPDEIRQNAVTEIDEGMDLGLKKRERPDMSVIKDLKSARVNINSESHIYQYEERYSNEMSWDEESETYEGFTMDPTIKFEEKYAAKTYTRALYESDILYEGDNPLEVYVTYKIGVRNNATNINSKIYELQDYFDNKYEFVNVGLDINEDGSIKEDSIIEGIIPSPYGDTYDAITIRNQDQSALLSLEPQTEGYIYVELQIKEECLDSVVDVANADGSENFVKLDNITEITAYGSTRSIKDEQGNVIEEKLYAGIDRDSQPGNTDVTNQDTWEDDTDKAPGLKLVLQEERTVSGKVFLDSSNELTAGEIANDGEIRQGNGYIDEQDTGIKDVKVTLKDSSGNIAQYYNETTGKFEDAVTYTDENGEYQLENFIPGDYQIAYEWGNETYKVQNYKSTVVNQEVWKAKMDSSSNGQWYKDAFKQNYAAEWNGDSEIRTSDAIDDIGDDAEEIGGTRKDIDDQTEEITYGKKEKVDNAYSESVDEGNDIKTKMVSTTPMFKVNVEYSTDITNNQDEYSIDENEEYTNPIPGFKNNIRSIDFGIVERARQVLELDKYIKTVRVILSNGNVLVNAQLDENGNLLNSPSYVTALPSSAANNGQVKLEIDQEVTQGATLETEYGLKVTNTSELDYATKDFYMYGNIPATTDKIVKLRASTIIDYLDNSITTNMEDNGAWDIIDKQDWKDDGKVETDTNRNYNEMLLSKGIEETFNETERILTTEDLDSDSLSPLETETKSADVGVIGYRLLSSTVDEVYFENYSEIIKVSKENGGSIVVTTPGNYVPTVETTYEEDDATSQSVTLVPPTGLETDYIAYTLLTLSSLGILVSGIILIKKYVLRRD